MVILIIVPNMYDFCFSVGHKIRYFEEYFCSYSENQCGSKQHLDCIVKQIIFIFE